MSGVNSQIVVHHVQQATQGSCAGAAEAPESTSEAEGGRWKGRGSKISAVKMLSYMLAS